LQAKGALGILCVPFCTADRPAIVSNYTSRGEKMDKQRVKGAIDEVVGNAKRQVGGLTGNTGTEVRGAAQQIKGKVETAVGKVKDAARDAKDNAAAPHGTCHETGGKHS
jgi:uncharacterized protein YjbJ (UPF0337 family)